MPERVLLADDNLTVQRVVAATLQKEGYAVVVVDNGPSALASAKNEPPDLILADFSLEGMNVFSFAKRTRQEGPLGHVPIVVLMNPTDCYDAGRLQEMGIQSALRKPICPDQLLQTVRGYLSGNHHADNHHSDNHHGESETVLLHGQSGVSLAMGTDGMGVDSEPPARDYIKPLHENMDEAQTECKKQEAIDEVFCKTPVAVINEVLHDVLSSDPDVQFQEDQFPEEWKAGGEGATDTGATGQLPESLAERAGEASFDHGAQQGIHSNDGCPPVLLLEAPLEKSAPHAEGVPLEVPIAVPIAVPVAVPIMEMDAAVDVYSASERSSSSLNGAGTQSAEDMPASCDVLPLPTLSPEDPLPHNIQTIIEKAVANALPDLIKSVLSLEVIQGVLGQVAREIVPPIAEAEIIKEIKRLEPECHAPSSLV